MNNDEAKKELDEIEEIEKTFNREKLAYRAIKYTYDFRNFRTIRTFDRDIYESKTTLEEANIDRSNLVDSIRDFNNKTRPQNDSKKQEKKKCS